MKSVLFGFGGALIAVVLWITVAFIVPLYLPYLIGRVRGTGGISSAYIGSGSILLAALIGFVVAFVWAWYRQPA